MNVNRSSFSGETNSRWARRIEQRRKQIDIGKNTPGYQEYTRRVPKDKRIPGLENSIHPVTPNPFDQRTKRSWDGVLREWRRLLHRWDHEGGSASLRTPESRSSDGDVYQNWSRRSSISSVSSQSSLGSVTSSIASGSSGSTSGSASAASSAYSTPSSSQFFDWKLDDQKSPFMTPLMSTIRFPTAKGTHISLEAVESTEIPEKKAKKHPKPKLSTSLVPVTQPLSTTKLMRLTVSLMHDEDKRQEQRAMRMVRSLVGD